MISFVSLYGLHDQVRSRTRKLLSQRSIDNLGKSKPEYIYDREMRDIEQANMNKVTRNSVETDSTANQKRHAILWGKSGSKSRTKNKDILTINFIYEGYTQNAKSSFVPDHVPWTLDLFIQFTIVA